MIKINKIDSSNIIGGNPSGRRCDRLQRRMLRNISNDNFGVATRLADKWLEICEGQGDNGGNIGSY
jgi:hypothetical protein